MSWRDYRWAKAQLGRPFDLTDELDRSVAFETAGDPPFYGLVMCAMHRADTVNEIKLRACWGKVWDELQARYDAPFGGQLESDPPELRRKLMREFYDGPPAESS